MQITVAQTNPLSLTLPHAVTKATPYIGIHA